MCNSQSSWTNRQCNEQEWQKTQTNDPVLKLSSLHFFEDQGDVVTTSLCTSQGCCRYVISETPNGVSVIRQKTYQWYLSRSAHYYVSMRSSETPNNVAGARLHHILEWSCSDSLYLSNLLCHELSLVRFHFSFKY